MSNILFNHDMLGNTIFEAHHHDSAHSHLMKAIFEQTFCDEKKMLKEARSKS